MSRAPADSGIAAPDPALRPVMTVIGAAMILDASLFSIMAPLLPHYKHAFGLSKAQAGVLVASYGVGTLLACLPAAALASRINVKGTVVVGLALMGVSSVAVGVARETWLLDAARFTQGAAGGVIWSAGFAWVSSLAPADGRGAVLGTLAGVAVAGSLLGPPLGALALTTSPLLVFGAIPALNLALSMFAVRLPSRPVTESTGMGALLRSVSPGPAAVALWLVFAPAMVLGLFGILGPLTLNRLGADAAVLAGTFVIAALGEAVVNPLVGRHFDRHGLLAVTRVALPVEAALLALLAVSHQAGLVAVIVILGIATTGAFWTPSAVMLTTSTDRAGIADVYAFALFNIAWAAGQSAGASGGGGLAQVTSSSVPCVVLGLALVGTLALVHRAAPAGAINVDPDGAA
ncbi:MAG TPA: MFS transporter [Solirubrobacteraceae bacterium]|nr:MFS transporter [Solirubrobacteraceae bacterium]